PRAPSPGPRGSRCRTNGAADLNQAVSGLSEQTTIACFEAYPRNRESRSAGGPHLVPGARVLRAGAEVVPDALLPQPYQGDRQGGEDPPADRAPDEQGPRVVRGQAGPGGEVQPLPPEPGRGGLGPPDRPGGRGEPVPEPGGTGVAVAPRPAGVDEHVHAVGELVLGDPPAVPAPQPDPVEAGEHQVEGVVRAGIHPGPAALGRGEERQLPPGPPDALRGEGAAPVEHGRGPAVRSEERRVGQACT